MNGNLEKENNYNDEEEIELIRMLIEKYDKTAVYDPETGIITVSLEDDDSKI